MTPRFDPTRALVVDLARGQLRDEESTARLNLPAHILLSFCDAAGKEATDAFSLALGTEIGRRALEQMGKNAEQATVEAWTEHLGGQVALLGLGDLSVEQWGKALVISIQGSPKGSEPLLGPLLSAALQRSLSRHASLVPFEASMGTSFLVVSPAAAEKARSLQSQGAGLGQVVEALHGGAA